MDYLKVANALQGKTLGKGRLYNPVTQLRCGLGQLLWEAGIPDSTLEFEEMSPANFAVLHNVYGMDQDDYYRLVNTNDELWPKRQRITGDALVKALIAG